MSERRYGILIASSQYQDQRLQNLRCPENDVDGLNEVLISKEHGNFSETSVLKNRPHHEVLLKFNQVLKKAGKDDLVLFYYSGHGKLNAAGKLHLATTDTIVDSLEATSIPLDTLKNYIDVSPANKFVFILDSCFSGAAGAAFTRGSVDDQLHLASGGRGTYIMTGSTGIQTALEKEADKYGIFTKHIIGGIKSGEAANDEGLITMDSLYSYIHDAVLKEASQEPMKWDLNVKGDLVIARSGKTRRSQRAKQIREMLLDYAFKGFLPDPILSKALQVIDKKEDQLSEEERRYDGLLDELLQKRLEVHKFIDEWYKIKSEIPQKEVIIKNKENSLIESNGSILKQFVLIFGRIKTKNIIILSCIIHIFLSFSYIYFIILPISRDSHSIEVLASIGESFFLINLYVYFMIINAVVLVLTSFRQHFKLGLKCGLLIILSNMALILIAITGSIYFLLYSAILISIITTLFGAWIMRKAYIQLK